MLRRECKTRASRVRDPDPIGPIQLVWMVNKTNPGSHVAREFLHHLGELDGVVGRSLFSGLARHLPHHRGKLDGVERATSSNAAEPWVDGRLTTRKPQRGAIPARPRVTAVRDRHEQRSAHRSIDVANHVGWIGPERGSALHGITPFQGYDLFDRPVSQRCAALHAGLSNDARSGLRTYGNGGTFDNLVRAQRADPEGVVFDSPGRSAAEPWVDGRPINRKPQRGAIRARPRATAARDRHTQRAAQRSIDVANPVRRTGLERRSALHGMTPFQGYDRFDRAVSQGCAALHPGLSNDARTGLRLPPALASGRQRRCRRLARWTRIVDGERDTPPGKPVASYRTAP